MNKSEYVKIVDNKIEGKAKEILLNQIDMYYQAQDYELSNHKYKLGDDVRLFKGTLLHGTYKNIEGLKQILKDGLISSWFIDGRLSKYPSSVGVWNLKQDCFLKDYINSYSGGTIRYYNQHDNKYETEIISYDNMNNVLSKILEKGYLAWKMEQTKEARFMPSLVQNKVQIGIIFNGNNKYIKNLLKGDILQVSNINDDDVRPFVDEYDYENFIFGRKNKDAFFTDRESAILFGVPSNFIEGILVGRKYEKDDKILSEIKKLLPNCYICNLDGKVILI